MRIVAFLPVKGSSERIENKNIKLLDGKPLFLHTLEKLIRSKIFDEVYLDSESEEIFELASDVPAAKLKRDKELATNRTDGNALFYNEVSKVEADIYVQILCTSPFIKIETIKAGIEILSNNADYDSVVLVRKEKQYRWNSEGPEYDIQRIPNSIDLPDAIIESMGLYICRREAALRTRRRIGDRPYLLEADSIESVDVNYPSDFALANFIAAGQRESERVFLRNLKSRMSSAMLSDILDELGVDSVVKGLKCNASNRKILGRSKTLKLRPLESGEDYRGIYSALLTYDSIVPGDVIVVENKCSEFAYFGELNANLAIRSGAVGAIVGGMTRDSLEVSELDFPVYSAGNYCRDVKRRAVMESFNRRIDLLGVQISSGDLIFADQDGVVCIPQHVEHKVIESVLDVVSKEKRILLEIAQGMSAFEIYQKFGEF